MDKQELLTLIQNIGTCEDEAERREQLSTLSEELTGLCDSNTAITQERDTLLANNEKLRDANMKLFLRVGEEKDAASQKQDETGIKDKPETKREFADLFDEKGGLK